jgi:hypothetical protein
MAERQFLIVVRNETGGGAGNKVGGAGGVGENGENSVDEKKQKTATDFLVKTVAGVASWKTAVNIIDTVWSHNNSLIEVRTGSRELQERTTWKYNTAKSFVMSGVTGAIADSQFGVPGAVVGAVVGLLKTTVSLTSSMALQQHTISENARIENMQQQTATQRVTVSGSRYMNAKQM